MAVPNVVDKFQMAQLIRFKAGSLDVATRCKNPDLKVKDADRRSLKALLEQWNREGYEATGDILWSHERLLKYDAWREKPGSMIKSAVGHHIGSAEGLEAIIKSRRSIRFWKKKSVPKDITLKVLEAGTFAPSAFNRLPWRFFVVETSEEALQEGDASNPGMFASAPVCIYVAVDERIFFEKYSGPMDAAFAMQNMLLMAHGLGLGACLVYQGEFADVTELKSRFGIPEYCKVYCSVLMGYPDENPDPPERMPVEDITTFIKLNSE